MKDFHKWERCWAAMASEHDLLILHGVCLYTHRSFLQFHRECDASNAAGARFSLSCW